MSNSPTPDQFGDLAFAVLRREHDASELRLFSWAVLISLEEKTVSTGIIQPMDELPPVFRAMRVVSAPHSPSVSVMHVHPDDAMSLAFLRRTPRLLDSRATGVACESYAAFSQQTCKGLSVWDEELVELQNSELGKNDLLRRVGRRIGLCL